MTINFNWLQIKNRKCADADKGVFYTGLDHETGGSIINIGALPGYRHIVAGGAGNL